LPYQEIFALATIRCRDKTFENIQAVLFDKDGTLANSESFLKSVGQKRSRLVDAKIPGVQEPLLMAFGLEGDQLNPAGLLAVASRRDAEIAAAAYIAETGRNWMEALEIAATAFAEADQYLKRKADHTPLFQGGLSLVESLAAANLKLGILSSDTTANVQDFIQKYGLEQIQLPMGTDAGLSKPDPLLYQQACSALDVLPAATLMIGDSQADAVMARAAGAGGCVGVTWGWSSLVHLMNVDVVVDRFEEIQVLSS